MADVATERPKLTARAVLHSSSFADVSESQAKAEDLVWVNPKDKTVHLRVSPSEAVTSSRNTIKLVSKAVHNQGLFIFDIERQPQVCGVWPAVWMTSLTQSWPE